MKILHVIDSGGFYGAEVMLLNLVNEQIQQGSHPVIASIGDSLIKEKAIEIEARKRGLPVKVFRMRPGLNIQGSKQILKFCQTENFDIIHSHGYKCNILLGLMPRFIRKKPMLSTVHGWTSTSGFTKMRIYEWLDAFCLRFVDGVVLVNKKMQQHPKITHLKKNITYIVDNGIPIFPPPPTLPLDSDISSFCEGCFVIGSIGRYSVEKGFDILLEAFSSIHKRINNAKLLLLGDGGQRDQYEEIISQKNLTDHVMLTGYRSDAWRYMELMQVYTISSLTEGLPITLLEAMRSKIPVVATQVGGIPDVLENGRGGTLVKPGHSHALAEAILQQYNEPKIGEKKTEFSFNKFNAMYSSRTMAANYYKIYETILSRE